LAKILGRIDRRRGSRLAAETGVTTYGRFVTVIRLRSTTPADLQEQLAMAADEVRWVVRLTPPMGRTIRDLLEIPLSFDVWHRENDALVAAASEMTLRELERRRLADVERLCTTKEYEARAKALSQDDSNAR
jgi:hypothetical protein